MNEFDKDFLSDLEEAETKFSGWDFSFISDTGRMRSGLTSWSYGSMATSLKRNAEALLDMGTGGGEFLSKLSPFPETVFATEGYEPNLPIAKEKLEPLGVEVFTFEEDSDLPFDDNQFDLILNQHESYSPMEVRRILRKDGIFLTQQVGGLYCLGINAALGLSGNTEYQEWNLDTSVQELSVSGFEVLFRKEEFPVQRFFDIGALVYYLKAIPWQAPDFSIHEHKQMLYEIHQTIQSTGFFDVKQHRFVIKARAI
ncbi:class I SAM-dependent methyltransferase [Bacillus salacetis]|uniref:Class I SAM-dependent methyltransferase n=1 Tax=Bacillus salacetis TaxID=2315464 RepID=A0A3A1QWI2_9BACI|nr:class I SAM-dependent methyltransferase [Bacillus salacetis]RIW31981.1 class I SAM-dependent methyltransferase [Bacillus salacetis]